MHLPASASADLFEKEQAEQRGEAAGNCRITFEVKHQTQTCFSQTDLTKTAAPVVSSTCGAIQSLTYSDHYWDLGCAGSGWNGYFSLNNWQDIYGDDGVDVTGAPNNVLVEGANSTLVTAASGSPVGLRLTVPAEGIIAFDWRKVGGSNFFFSIDINDRPADEAAAEGAFLSDPLYPGDQLTLRLRATSDEPAALRLQNFHFYTNATGVTVRRWLARDHTGRQAQADQFLPRRRNSLAEVIFPANRDGVEGPLYWGESMPAPDQTGYPVFDADRNLQTTSDQYRPDQEDCGYQLEYRDENYWDGAYCVTLRHWRISDGCQGNSMEETQIIKQVTGPCLDSTPGGPAQPGKRATSTKAGPLLPQKTKEVPEENVADNYSPEPSCDRPKNGLFIVE